MSAVLQQQENQFNRWVTFRLAEEIYGINVMQVQEVLRRLGATNFRASLVALQMIQDLSQVDEFSRKSYVTGGDQDYLAQAKQMREAYERGLTELRGIALTSAEEAEAPRSRRPPSCRR